MTVQGSSNITVEDYRNHAKRVLDADIFGFINGGAGDGSTAVLNRSRLDSIRLAGRVMRPGTPPSLSTRFGPLDLEVPIAIAPSAYHQLVVADGELSTAKAAAKVGVPFILSSMSTTPFEMLAETGADIWFQLYGLKDASLERRIVEGAVQSGCKALVITVDVPVFGKRLEDVRSGFKIPAEIASRNKIRAQAAITDGAGVSTLPEAAFVDRYFNLNVNWGDIEALIKSVDLPVFVKGILSSEDALLAKSIGAAGCIISNHGGRQFDAHPASIDALSAARSVSDEGFSLGVDGGFESATDVIRGFACGAKLVLLGRPILWALAAGGEDALVAYLGSLIEDITRSMKLCGLHSLDNAPSALFQKPD